MDKLELASQAIVITTLILGTLGVIGGLLYLIKLVIG